MPWQPAAAVASSAAPAVPRAARTAVAVVVSAKGNAMSDSKKGCLWHVKGSIPFLQILISCDCSYTSDI